jgi:hypothetical protein
MTRATRPFMGGITTPPTRVESGKFPQLERLRSAADRALKAGAIEADTHRELTDGSVTDEELALAIFNVQVMQDPEIGTPESQAEAVLFEKELRACLSPEQIARAEWILEDISRRMGPVESGTSMFENTRTSILHR